MADARDKGEPRGIRCALQRLLGRGRRDTQAGERRDSIALQRPDGCEATRLILTGVMHEPGRAEAVAGLNLRERVQLRREPDNPHDPNAILVVGGGPDGVEALGYVPRRVAALLAPHMDAGHNPLEAVVTELTSDIAGSVVGAAANVYLPRELSARIEGMSEEMHYYADVGTEGVTYVMVDCDEAVLNQLCTALTDAGFKCTRTGLAHRPAPNGRQYRWYLRLEGDITKEEIDEFFLGAPGEWTGTLEDWMAQFDSETDGLKARERAARRAGRGLLGSGPPDGGAAASGARRGRREALESQLMDVVDVLLPEVEFLRDSRKVVLRELSSFRPVFAELHAIATEPVVKGQAVEGASGWRERHFNTGQKDDGRLYYKRQDGKWLVLVSFKSSQKHDVRWLGKR